MVLRSIPVTRSIWRWLLPASNSVAIVVCRCGFKTFNPVSLKSEGVTVTSCQGLTEAMKNGVRPPSHQGRGGGIWGGHKWGSLGGHQGLKGPIPMAWLNEAARLPGKALNLGIAIWWLAGMAQTKTFKLTGKALAQLGVSRDAAADALKRLEGRGLIRVQRAPGQRPTVEILSVARKVTKLENTE